MKGRLFKREAWLVKTEYSYCVVVLFFPTGSLRHNKLWSSYEAFSPVGQAVIAFLHFISIYLFFSALGVWSTPEIDHLSYLLFSEADSRFVWGCFSVGGCILGAVCLVCLHHGCSSGDLLNWSQVATIKQSRKHTTLRLCNTFYSFPRS